MAYPMGEAKAGPLRVDFDRRLKLEFHGRDLSSDAGLLSYRELDDVLRLTGLSGVWNDRVHERKPPKMIILDVDSSESPTYGEQEGSADNGHFGCTCYHPLFCFNQFGDLERCLLRPGHDLQCLVNPAVHGDIVVEHS